MVLNTHKQTNKHARRVGSGEHPLLLVRKGHDKSVEGYRGVLSAHDQPLLHLRQGTFNLWKTRDKMTSNFTFMFLKPSNLHSPVLKSKLKQVRERVG